MRDTVEAEQLAEIVVICLRNTITSLTFQILFHILIISLFGTFTITGDVYELEFRMIFILLAQTGSMFNTSTTGTTERCPKIYK